MAPLGACCGEAPPQMGPMFRRVVEAVGVLLYFSGLGCTRVLSRFRAWMRPGAAEKESNHVP